MIFIVSLNHYPQNWVREPFGRWRLSTKSASAALNADDPINYIQGDSDVTLFYIYAS